MLGFISGGPHLVAVASTGATKAADSLVFRGVATGGYIGIYTSQNQSTLKDFMWLFFSCDPGQIR